MNLEAMIKSDLSLLEGAIRGDYLTPYDAIELMSNDLREWLMAALYAYSANADALTDKEEVFVERLKGRPAVEGEFAFNGDNYGVPWIIKKEEITDG